MYYFIYLTLKIIILILIFTSATGNEIRYLYCGFDAFAAAEAIVSEVVKKYTWQMLRKFLSLRHNV
ncbi:hypothetical protein GCM10009120_22520 [Sphingobacterium siyangense subsp. cladoniae]